MVIVFKPWHSQSFTWFGRNNIPEMDIFPRLLYLLQTLPVHVPRAFLSSVKMEFINCLWSYGARRICDLSLRWGSGMGPPEPFKYHQAVHTRRALDWIKHGAIKLWVGLEQKMASLPLPTLLWQFSTEV